MITAFIKTKPVHNVGIKKTNATDWPKEYVCNFLEPGVVSYEDVGQGIAMLPSEAIDRMLQSFVGKPVVIDHVDVTPQTFEKEAVGLVTRVWRESNGWAYCAFLLTDDKAKDLVSKGYSVSCAFDVHEVGPGGEWHAIKYDEEIQNGQFTHLALVDNPRYEGCRIFANSKGAASLNRKENGAMTSIHPDAGKRVEIKEGMFSGKQGKIQVSDGKDMMVVLDRGEGTIQISSTKIRFLNSNSQDNSTQDAKFKTGDKNPQEKKNMAFKFWIKSKKKNAAEQRDEITRDPSNVMVDVDGKKVSVQELLNSKKKANSGAEVETATMEDKFVDAEGTEHSIAELVENYRENSMSDEEKKNAAEEEEKKKKEDAKRKAAKEEEEKKNAAEAEEEKKNVSEKEEEEKKRKDAKEKEEKENARRAGKDGHQFFEKVKGLRENADAGGPSVMVETMGSKCNRGEELFGQAPK